jgi:hypothetical protein
LYRPNVERNISAPRVPAGKAVRFMNTDHLSAPGADPPFFFISDETTYPKLPDVLKIVDHAHAVFGSIALIQMFQPVAGEAVASEAVTDFPLRHVLTVLDSACDAGCFFDAVVAPASGAYIDVSYICMAKAAVHSTGSDQRCSNRIYFYRSTLRHVCILQKICKVILF